MHAELARQLRCRLLAATRRQCHFRLERSAKIPSLPSHPSEPPDRPPHSGDSTPYQGAQFLGSTSPVALEMSYVLPFVLDADSDSTFHRREELVSAVVEAESGEQVTFPGVTHITDRSIITPEHIIRFDPESVFPFIAELEHPEMADKRVAFREAPPARSQHFGDVIEPTNFFGCGSSTQMFWEIPTQILQCEKGEHGEAGKKWAEESVQVEQASGPGGVWYRIVLLMNDSTMRYSYICSPQAGYHLVKFAETGLQKNGNNHPRINISTDWRQYNNVYVPVSIKESIYNNGQLKISREFQIQECSVNQPIAPDQFTYKALGMKDDDIIVDRLEKKVYVYRDGKEHEFANFGDVWDPLEDPQISGESGFSAGRRIAIMFTVLLIIVLVGMIVMKQRRA